MSDETQDFPSYQPVKIEVDGQVFTKKDRLLEPKEMAEDAFWLAFAGLLWVPQYSDFYDTPIPEGLNAVCDLAPLRVTVLPESLKPHRIF